MATRYLMAPAGPADDTGLRDLARRLVMPGKIRFFVDRQPDYFNALRVEGREAAAYVCRDGGRIIGCAHRAVKPAYINGRVAKLGYLGGLRLEPGYRGGMVLARAFAYLRNLHRDGRAPYYLTTVMEDNPAVMALLTSGRCGLPEYRDLGTYVTLALRTGRKMVGGTPACEIRPAAAADVPRVLAFLAAKGSRRQFYPAYAEDDFGADGKLLYGLEWQDVLLAFHHGDLAGVMGAWDQRGFRQIRVAGYALGMELARRALGIIRMARGLPPLPRPGEATRHFTVALTCVRDDDPVVFRNLLAATLRARAADYDFALVGLHERDPLLDALPPCAGLRLASRLFLVSWPDDAVTPVLDNRVPYLELGSL